MSKFRRILVDRMIYVYGFEHPAVIEFCELCEDETTKDEVLEILVEINERFPKF